MLEHQKTVLLGVESNKKLFKKELIKSLTWLNSNDQALLKKWVLQKFYKQHAEIIEEVFYSTLSQAS